MIEAINREFSLLPVETLDAWVLWLDEVQFFRRRPLSQDECDRAVACFLDGMSSVEYVTNG